MNFADAVDLAEIARLDTPVHSRQTPRWERKAAAAAMKARSTTTTPAKGLKTPKKTPKGDRFIPNRGSMNLDVSSFNLTKENVSNEENKETDDNNNNNNDLYKSHLAEHLLDGSSTNDKILAFKQKAPLPDEAHQNNLRVLYSANRSRSEGEKKKKVARHIAQTPERILDAPDIVDDYYLNVLDWGKDNVLAIALDKTVYLWDATSGSITELCSLETQDDYVTSLSWVKAGSGQHLAVGTNGCAVQLWDVTRQKQLREMRGHNGRVCALSWNAHILTSGARDGAIHNHDVRIAEHLTSTYSGHTQEVCGLSWSPDGSTLASGGNDNVLNLWDVRRHEEGAAHRLTQHQAAVKALAWCPWQSNLLASGAGTADRHLRFWNTTTGTCVNAIDTKSQVCAIQWSRHQRELVTSHGFAQNQLTVWSYPSLAKVTELYGHAHRVLHMAQSPDGQTVCSVSPDETLRFWKIWAQESSSKKRATVSSRSTRSINNLNISSPFCLTRLHFRANRIGVAGVQSLSRALTQHTTIHYLDLSSNPLGDAGVCELVQRTLRKRNGLRTLWLSDVDMGDESLRDLASVLTLNRVLENLSVCRNSQISLDGWRALADALDANLTLQQLYHDATGLTSTSIQRALLSHKDGVWQRVHRKLLPFAIAMNDLLLPSYVLLYIFDYLPYCRFGSEARKIQLLIDVRRSIERVRDRRTQTACLGEMSADDDNDSCDTESLDEPR